MMNNHQLLIAEVCKSGQDVLRELNPSSAHLLHMVLGVAGEAGELVDAVKKHAMYSKPLDIANVIEELGDIEFYLEGLRMELGITREQCVDANIAKLRKRYPQGYTNQAAQQRADKEVK